MSSNKLRPIQGTVVKAIKETPDTWTLKIQVDDRDKDYLAGQFISIDAHQFPELIDLIKYFEFEKGKKEPIRAYSLSSAPHEDHIAITIKPEAYYPHKGSFPPLLSPMLASNVFVGRPIEFIGYTGAFIMPNDLAHLSHHAIHLAAGSGIVPSFSIIKDELFGNKHNHMKHTLIFVNKTKADIIFHDEINLLAQKFPSRFSVRYFLTQESGDEGCYVSGRPSFADIQELIIDLDQTLLFACGPALTKWQKKQAVEDKVELKPRFMEWVQSVVQDLKLDKKRYKREVYG